MSAATCGIPPAESAPDIASLIRATRLRSSSGVASKHASSPPFFVRPGAAGLLLPSVSRKGVRNAWAFHRTRGPVCKGAEKDAHELPVGRRSTPAFRTRSFIRTCCITPLVGSKRRHRVLRSNHAEPSAWGCTWVRSPALCSPASSATGSNYTRPRSRPQQRKQPSHPSPQALAI